MKIKVPETVNIDFTKTIRIDGKETIARPMDFGKDGQPIKYAMSCPFCGSGIFSDLETELFCTNQKCKAGYVEEIPEMANPFINPLFEKKATSQIIDNIKNKTTDFEAFKAFVLENKETPKPEEPKSAKPKKPKKEQGIVKKNSTINAIKNAKPNEVIAPKVEEVFVPKEVAPDPITVDSSELDILLNDNVIKELLDE